MIKWGKRGQYNPCLYWSSKLGVKTLVHVDDFVSVGRRDAVKKFREMLSKRFEIKTCIIGNQPKLGEV